MLSQNAPLNKHMIKRKGTDKFKFIFFFKNLGQKLSGLLPSAYNRARQDTYNIYYTLYSPSVFLLAKSLQ